MNLNLHVYYIYFQFIEKILQSTPAGQAVLSEYKSAKKLEDQTRRVLVNLLVGDMMEKHG